MSAAELRAVELAHGVVAWLATLALAFAAGLALRRREPPAGRRALVTTSLATVLVTLAAVLGLALHTAYDAHLRQHLFIRSATLGWLFERKHHLAVVVVLLAWCGLLAEVARVLTPSEPKHGARDALARTVSRSFVAAAGLAGLASIIGSIVARVARF